MFRKNKQLVLFCFAQASPTIPAYVIDIASQRLFRRLADLCHTHRHRGQAIAVALPA
jgi:hypothetical protein